MSVNDRGAPLASTQEVMMIQEAMATVGFYSGAIDGLAGSNTMRAVRAYKKQSHMPVNNALTDEFITHLRNEV